jgi:hypothetical protein
VKLFSSRKPPCLRCRHSGRRSLAISEARACRERQCIALRPLLVAAIVLCTLVMLSVAARAGNVAGYVGSDTPRGEVSSQAASSGPQELATGTVLVRLNPSNSAVVQNDIFRVDIQVLAGSQLVDGAEFHLSFSQTYLQVVEATGNLTHTIYPGAALPIALANLVYTSTEPADIYFAACVSPQPGTPRPSGTFTLATVYFKALRGTGGASTPLIFAEAEVTSGGGSVLGSVENGSVTISGETPPTPTPPMRTVFLPIVLRQR